VKIGIERDVALPSAYGEEQSHLLDERNSLKKEGHFPGELQPEQEPISKTKHEETPSINPLEELQKRIAELEGHLKEADVNKQALEGKISFLEAEVSAAKSMYTQKEREFTDSVAAAKAQARTEGREQGHGEGLQKGYNDGLAKAGTEVESRYKEKFSSLVAAMEGISANIEKQFAELAELNQPRMLRLWQSMLKKMLQHEMSLAPEGVFEVLADVLSRLSDKNHVVIYVSPDDLALLEDNLEGEFGDILRGVKHLELKPDAHIDKGSCLVETNLGVYDARWRTQFEQIDSVVESLFKKIGKPLQTKAKHSLPSKKKQKTTEAAQDE